MEFKTRVTETEYMKVLRNAALFLAPAALLALIQLQGGASWEEIANILYLWLLNTAIDLLRKFIAAGK